MFQIVTSKGNGRPVSTTPPSVCSMKRFAGSVGTAGAVFGLVMFPGASGKTAWRQEEPTANGLLHGGGVAEAQATTTFDGSPRRRLQKTDDALDIYGSVSAPVCRIIPQGGDKRTHSLRSIFSKTRGAGRGGRPKIKMAALERSCRAILPDASHSV